MTTLERAQQLARDDRPDALRRDHWSAMIDKCRSGYSRRKIPTWKALREALRSLRRRCRTA